MKKLLKSPSRSLYARLTFGVMLTVLVVFCIITFILSNITQKTILSGSEENAKSRMEIANQHINSVLVGVEVAVANTVPEIQPHPGNPDQLYDIVHRLLELNPNIIGSAIAFEPGYFPEKGKFFSPYAYRAPDGTIQTKQLGTADYEYHDMEWYKMPKQLGQAHWSEPYFDSGGGEQLMTTFSQPLFDQQGQMYAVMTADVSLDWLTELVTASDIDFNRHFLGNDNDSATISDPDFFATHAYTFIIGRSGTYIAHPLHERILNKTYLSFVEESGDSLDNQAGRDMLEGHSGKTTIKRDGVKYLLYYAPIERTGWSMTTVIPAKVLFNKSQHSAVLIILIMLAGLLALFFVCRTLLRRITRPLWLFASSADEIAKGNLTASLPNIETQDEMKRLSDSFSLMQTSLQQQMEELRTTTASKAAIESELNVASDIQRSMLPKIFPPYPERDDIDIYGQLTPAKAVGGDLFDFYIRDEKLFFCIGDVSGKGVPASLVMAVTRAQFRTISVHVTQPNRIVEQMNEAMAQDNDSSMFVTLFLGVLDLPTGRLHYCNAGHDAPVLIGSNIGLLPCDSNLPVGVMSGWTYTAQETQINPQTTIFLYTDGLTEAENANHEIFTEKRMLDAITSHQFTSTSTSTSTLVTQHSTPITQHPTPITLISHMTEAVQQFVGEAEQSDDLTMLAIQYIGQQQQQDVRFQRSITLTNDIDEIHKLADFIDQVCEVASFNPATIMQMNLAIEEAVVNIMNYAYPQGTTGNINVEARLSDSSLVFVISDTGKPFDPTAQGEVDITLSAEERPVGGLGIHLIRQLMDSVNYEYIDNHNILTLTKKIN